MKFVVIDRDEIFYLQHDSDVVDAQDRMAELGIESTMIHYENGKCGKVTVIAKRSEVLSTGITESKSLTPLEAAERLLNHFGKDCRYDGYDTDEKLVIDACATALSRLVVSRDDDVLIARVFVTIPYTKQYSDDSGILTYAIIRARDVKHAIELVTCRGGGLIDDECWWSKDANENGDTVERSDATCFYHMWLCDCGDSDCGDEKNPHESQTETIIFNLDAAHAWPTRAAAVVFNNDREPAVEYLET